MALFFNGEPVTPEEMAERVQESTDAYMAAELDIMSTTGCSHNCASSIAYLRGRTRWTEAKEAELLRLDRAGLPLPNVLTGEF